MIPLVYRRLHRIAESYLRREPQDHTLQATALIHEAYLRLAEHGPAEYKDHLLDNQKAVLDKPKGNDQEPRRGRR